ncbi:MAG TPA: hypothetical protein PK006_06265 [Saprospiraceae bacterium]|nr:hypothetical protein [Saprospiraceae bacterium]
MQSSVLTRDCYIDANDNIYISGYLSGAYRIWVIKLDKDLNVIWSNFYGNSVFYYMGGMGVNSNEVINIVGIDQFPDQNSQVSFSMLINKDGQLIKYEKIGVVSTTFEALYSSTPIGKSGFILVGTGGVFDGTKYPLWVMRIDENGNRLWNKFWVQSETDFKRGIFASTVLTINDSEIVIFGRKGDDQNATNPSTKEINTILVKMDINGNILKFKEYKSLPTSFNYSFGGAYDGNYYYFAGSNGTIGNGSFIAKIDQNFDVVEARTIDKSGFFFYRC